MPYARKVLQEHQGTIVVDSDLGKGTQVTIELPATEGEVAAEPLTRTSHGGID
jgi:signal transduction histidine kinase